MTPREAFDRNKQPRQAKRRKKFCYVGVPTIFKLELACQTIEAAFCTHEKFAGVYLVGSSLERPDFRDVDVVCMLDDDTFAKLFPDATFSRGKGAASFEFDARWQLMTVMMSDWLTGQIGMQVDFKFQPMTWANAHHSGHRQALGLRMVSPRERRQD